LNRLNGPAKKLGDKIPISKEQVIRLLELENRTRLSESYQQLFDIATKTGSSEIWRDTQIGVQKHVLKEFGLSSSPENLHLLQSALSLYPDDQELRNIPYYSKYNRCKQGNLKVGDCIKDLFNLIKVYDLSSDEILPFGSVLSQHLPTVLLAGSIT